MPPSHDDSVTPRSPPDGNDWTVDELSDVQRKALRALAELDRCGYTTRARDLSG